VESIVPLTSHSGDSSYRVRIYSPFFSGKGICIPLILLHLDAPRGVYPCRCGDPDRITPGLLIAETFGKIRNTSRQTGLAENSASGHWNDVIGMM
jgi:hypothetical protein